MNINPELVKLAEWRLDELNKQTKNAADKSAFVPPGDPAAAGGDPSGGMGGAPPMDPSMMGGMGGAPPMDPSMMGGAPPMDPAMMGGGAPVPGGGGMNAESIAQIVTQTMQQQGMAGGAGGAAGAAGKMAKPDINTVAIDIFQVKKMLQYLFNTMGIPLPPDILDGPNRNPSTGIPMPAGTPGSTSDPAVTAANAQQPPGGAPGGAQGGAIPPIDPMQAAGPGAGGVGGEKMGGEMYMGGGYGRGFDTGVINRASALAAIYRKLRNK